jgi:hypothetical protein
MLVIRKDYFFHCKISGGLGVGVVASISEKYRTPKTDF